MVNSLAAALLEGLFPEYCALCKLRSHRPLPLCADCQEELQVNVCSCKRCAIPLPPPRVTGAPLLCGRCLQTPPAFQRVIAPWLYCDRLAYLIQHWKFNRERRLTPLLASLWLQQAGDPAEVDVLIPVPLHWRRLWQRGFNQSELLCRYLQRHSPTVSAARMEHRTVRRNRPTAAQSGMGAAQRRANLRGAFTVNKRYDKLRVAIVDDVFTTGATAAALASALRRAGASRVDVWCLARTPAPGG